MGTASVCYESDHCLLTAWRLIIHLMNTLWPNSMKGTGGGSCDSFTILSAAFLLKGSGDLLCNILLTYIVPVSILLPEMLVLLLITSKLERVILIDTLL